MQSSAQQKRVLRPVPKMDVHDRRADLAHGLIGEATTQLSGAEGDTRGNHFIADDARGRRCADENLRGADYWQKEV